MTLFPNNGRYMGPPNAQAATKAYVGLARHHGRGHLVRAALEGVCQQLRLVLDAIRDAGNEVTEVRATGGFARSALWRQMLADVLDAPVGFAASEEGSARGAAILGLQALDLAERIEVAQPAQVIQPHPDAAAVYAAQRPAFVALGQALAPYQPT